VEASGVEKGAEEKKKMKSFSEKVYQLTRQIPKGKVVTYGQVAKKIGKPKAARAVGNAVHRNPDPKTIPCHRVVNRDGRLAPNFAGNGWQEQKRRLLKEGVKFKDQMHVDLTKRQWNFEKI
jgi:methylated-DNA-protein-cysteine methyltransferase-like protein